MPRLVWTCPPPHKGRTKDSSAPCSLSRARWGVRLGILGGPACHDDRRDLLIERSDSPTLWVAVARARFMRFYAATKYNHIKLYTRGCG